MARSQNGWPVLREPPPAVELVPGVRVTVLPGDVAWLFTRLARFIHENVEPLDTPVYEGGRRLPTDDWGWAFRPVRGQETGYSNHASATAIDLNATQHGRGRERTWTTAEVAEIDRHLSEYHGVIRWGEHYQSTVDGMHFEIIGTPEQIRRVRTELQARDEDDMPTAAELAQALLKVPVKLMPYVDQGIDREDKDDVMPFGDIVQHAAGQAAGALRAVAAQGRTLAQVVNVVGNVQADVRSLQEAVARLEARANETPPASGAGG